MRALYVGPSYPENLIQLLEGLAEVQKNLHATVSQLDEIDPRIVE
jgi:hypothetical protein